MNEEVVNLQNYIGRREHRRDLHNVRLLRATRALEPYYECYQRILDQYGEREVEVGRVTLRLVTDEDQQ